MSTHDDWMDLAHAVGATPGTQPPIEFTAGPQGFGPHWTDTYLAHFVQQCSNATGLDEHTRCEHRGCTTWICVCLEHKPCQGTQDLWCSHGHYVCEEHRMDTCGDCWSESREPDRIDGDR